MMSYSGIAIKTAAMLLMLLAVAVIAGIMLRSNEPARLAPDASEANQITFLAVGRQGYGNTWARQIADAMERLAADRPTHFAVLLGDNFYPAGVHAVDDRQWVTKFESLYDGPNLRGMPFYAVLGNHDHMGSVQAQLDYAQQRLGSGRFRMDGPWYVKDFGKHEGRVLLRMVFMDSVAYQEQDPAEQEAFLRDAFARPGDPVWRVVAGHYACRSESKRQFTVERTLTELLPIVSELNVDLLLSANDQFQQLLEMPGEPLHVSTNGGGEKLEADIGPIEEAGWYIQARPGFARICVAPETISVELWDRDGREAFIRTIPRTIALEFTPALPTDEHTE